MKYALLHHEHGDKLLTKKHSTKKGVLKEAYKKGMLLLPDLWELPHIVDQLSTYNIDGFYIGSFD